MFNKPSVISHAPPPAGRERPVFLDESRLRWNGFLTLAGSGLATLVFLAGVLWFSVAARPAIKPLPVQAASPAVEATSPVVKAAALPPVVPSATPVATTPDPAANLPNSADVPLAQVQRTAGVEPPRARPLRSAPVSSPSIEVIGKDAGASKWVTYIGSTGEVRELGFFTPPK